MLKTSKRSHEKNEILQNPRNGVQKWWPDPPRALQKSSRIGSRIEPESKPKKYSLFTWPGEAQSRQRETQEIPMGSPNHQKTFQRAPRNPLERHLGKNIENKCLWDTSKP